MLIASTLHVDKALVLDAVLRHFIRFQSMRSLLLTYVHC
jgi:hypothetical protein